MQAARKVILVKALREMVKRSKQTIASTTVSASAISLTFDLYLDTSMSDFTQAFLQQQTKKSTEIDLVVNFKSCHNENNNFNSVKFYLCRKLQNHHVILYQALAMNTMHHYYNNNIITILFAVSKWDSTLPILVLFMMLS